MKRRKLIVALSTVLIAGIVLAGILVPVISARNGSHRNGSHGKAVKGPSLVKVSPASGRVGESLDVKITAKGTRFVDGKTRVDLGSGITVDSVTVKGRSSATASITIADDADPGRRYVKVVTGAERPASLKCRFTVLGLPAISGIDPASGTKGDTLDVAIEGVYTNFEDGVSEADFGEGITVNSTEVSDMTNATANITIDEDAASGTRDVNVITDDQEPIKLEAGFTVAGRPGIASVDPVTGIQGTTIDVAIEGSDTNFQDGLSVADFGDGITVNSTEVTDATHAKANISIGAEAAPGPRDVSVATGEEAVEALIEGFEVVIPPTIVSVDPEAAPQGATLDVMIEGDGTNFDEESIASFGEGVDVNSLEVSDASHVTANITIAADAAVGARDVNVVTGDEEPVALAGGFEVLEVKIEAVDPARAYQGASLDVALVGLNTNFAEGSTTADFGEGITVDSMTVVDLTNATATITIADDAAVGPRDVTISTDDEALTLAEGFAVDGAPVLATVDPAEGVQGATLDVAIEGNYTNFAEGSTASFGEGVTVNSLAIADATHATANITIAMDAAAGPRDVNVVTGDEEPKALAGGFEVKVLPGYTPVGRNVRLELDGGVTVVFANVRKAGVTTCEVASDPKVKRYAAIAGSARTIKTTARYKGAVRVVVKYEMNKEDVKKRSRESVYLLHKEHRDWKSIGSSRVNGRPQVSGKVSRLGDFVVARKAALPAYLMKIDPAVGFQGATIDVAIQGRRTHFAEGSAASFGEGVTVNSLAIADATHATANITIAMDAAAGPRDVNVVTGDEEPKALAGGFEVKVLPGYTPVGRNVRLELDGGVTVVFANVRKAGVTTCEVASDPKVKRYAAIAGSARTIKTTARYKGAVRVSMSYDPANGNKVQILYKSRSNWVSVKTSCIPRKSLVTAKLGKLSDLVLAKKPAPAPRTDWRKSAPKNTAPAGKPVISDPGKKGKPEVKKTAPAPVKKAPVRTAPLKSK